MKKIVINSALLILFITGTALSANAQAQKKADRQTAQWRYETSCAGVGADGTKLLKVYSYSKKPSVATEQCKKNAVHAMIFQGAMGTSGCPTIKPLTNNPALEQEKADFFDAFFAEGGKYMKFVTMTNAGAGEAGDVMKIGKEYKVGVVVSVMYDQLRKDLEAAGIIKGLSSGF